MPRKTTVARRRKGRGIKAPMEIVASGASGSGTMTAVNAAAEGYKSAMRMANQATSALKRMGIRPKSTLERKGVYAGSKRKRNGGPVSGSTATNAGINQLTRSYTTYNRPITVLKAVRKLDERDTHTCGLIWQRIEPLNATTASMVLYNLNAVGGTNVHPVHVFRIDDKLDQANFTASSHAMAYELTSSDTTNTIGWTRQLGNNLANTNNDAAGYQLLWSNGLASQNAGQWDHTILRHVNMDLMLRGIRTRPTTFKVQLVSFLREDVAPEFTPTAESTRFWTQYMKPLVAHPLAVNPRDFHSKQYMKVHRTWWHKFQPDQTTNLDTTPLQHRMTIKLNLNRYCDYTRVFTTPSSNVNQVYENEPETLIESVPSGLNGHVGSWKARMYVIVSASVNAGANTVAESCPQYDISIRAVHTLRESQ